MLLKVTLLVTHPAEQPLCYIGAGQPWATSPPGSQGSWRPPLAGRNRVLSAGACIASAACRTIATLQSSQTEDMMSGTPASACHSVCLTNRKKAHHTAHRLVLNTCCTGPGHSHQGSSATPVQVAHPAVNMSHGIVQQAATEYTAAMFALVCSLNANPLQPLPDVLHCLSLQPTQPCSNVKRATIRPQPALDSTGLGSPQLRPHPSLPLNHTNPPPHLLLVPPASHRPARHTHVTAALRAATSHMPFLAVSGLAHS